MSFSSLHRVDWSSNLYGGHGVRYIVPFEPLATRVLRIQATESINTQHSHKLGIWGCVADDQSSKQQLFLPRIVNDLV